MREIAFDTETYMSPKHGNASLNSVPKLVCVSFYDGETSELYLADEGVRRFFEYASDPEVYFVTQNGGGFDYPVISHHAQKMGIDRALETVFDVVLGNRAFDTAYASWLGNITRGGVSLPGRGSDLASLARRYLGKKLEGKSGEDVWRYRYNELHGVPVEHWPEAADEYARMDAEYTWKVWQAQKLENMFTLDLRFQLASGYMLGLMSAWGVLVDEEWALRLWDYFDAKQRAEEDVLMRPDIGVVYYDPKEEKRKVSKKRLAAIYEEAWTDRLGYVPEEHKTDKTRETATNKDALEALAKLYENEEDMPEAFRAYSRRERMRSAKSTWLQPMLDAAETGSSLHPEYKTLVDTGRMSAKKPSIMNIPGRMSAEDKAAVALDPDALYPALIRGAFIPRPGYVYVDCDYSSLELLTLAQICTSIIGSPTPMLRAINEGMDLHSVVGAQILGISYEEFRQRLTEGDPECKLYRQLSKALNFSAPVGGSAETLAKQAAVIYGVEVPLDTMREALKVWTSTWPGVRRYQDFYLSNKDRDGCFIVPLLGPGGKYHRQNGQTWRRRLCSKKTEALNTPFQGLGSDVMKMALIELGKACYLERTGSVLLGSRPVLVIHDQVVVEVPEDKAEAGLAETIALMTRGLKAFCPDLDTENVTLVEGSILTERWAKT